MPLKSGLDLPGNLFGVPYRKSVSKPKKPKQTISESDRYGPLLDKPLSLIGLARKNKPGLGPIQHSGSENQATEDLQSPGQQGVDHREQAVSNFSQQRERADAARKLAREQAFKMFEEHGQRGLTPERENQLRNAAGRRIGEEVAGAEEELIAKQGRRGIKGGAAFAQGAHLRGLGAKAKALADEEVNRLSADAALKKLALALTQGEGAAGEQYLGEEAELNRLENEDESRFMRNILKQIQKDYEHRNFNLVG